MTPAPGWRRLFRLSLGRRVEVGPIVGQELRAERAGQDAREVGDDDAVQRELRHLYVCLSVSRSASVLRRILKTLWISVP